MTPRQLTNATLQTLAEQLLKHQINLKIVQSEKRMYQDAYKDMSYEEARLRALINGLKSKIQWEFKTNAKLLGLKVAPQDQTDQDNEGDEWKAPEHL